MKEDTYLERKKFLDCIERKRCFHISAFSLFYRSNFSTKTLGNNRKTPVSITSIVISSFPLYSFLFIIIRSQVPTYRESDALQCPAD